MIKSISHKVLFPALCILAAAAAAAGQNAGFRIGEKITYSVSFDRFNDIAYAETNVVSRGRFGDRDAIELRGKFKTRDFWSAAFFLIDESRVVFVTPETGVPLYVSRSQNSGIPKNSEENFLSVPAANFDLLSLIYKIRAAGGAGAATISENGAVSTVTFGPIGAEHIKTDAGEFDTQLVSVQSDYFGALGIKDLRINLSTDDARVPALIRFKTDKKGEYRMAAASVQVILPEPQQTPAPVVVRTPLPAPTPRQTPTPAPYVDNRPLRGDLAFDLGETLEYRVSSGERVLGEFTLRAQERKEFKGRDSLLLTATATTANPGNPLFTHGDRVAAYVDPESLTPFQLEISFRGDLGKLNDSVSFDRETSKAMFGSGKNVDVPVGTQSLLSLLYALRSYNLKPSRDINNPVNDTRVAVFWNDAPVVFTMRPSRAELISIGGEKVAAQMISISTGNTDPLLDSLQIKIWLGNDERRLPLRITAGGYQADLISAKNSTK